MEKKEFSILDHLQELKQRLLISLGVIAVFSFLGSRLVPIILKSLVNSAGNLVFINPTEAFWVNIKIALIIGGYCALPIITYQLWRFIASGLYKNERKNIAPLALISFILFNLGCIFCYLIIFPIATKFLLSYSQGVLQPMISVNSYLSFLLAMLLAFGIVFQLPLATAVLTKIGIIDHKGLIKYRRFSIVGIFIVAAVITPPDVFTQLTLAVPLLLLYEISILISKKIK